MRAVCWLLLSFALLLDAAAAPACPQRLRVGFMDRPIPPYLEGSGNRFAQPAPGWAVAWARQTFAALGCEPEWVRAPVRRLAQELARDDLQFIVGFAHSAEREALMRFPQGSDGALDTRLNLGVAEVVLFALASREDHGDRAEPGAEHPVGVVPGAVEEPLARARGWSVELAPTHDANLAKLRAGRVHWVLAPRLAFGVADLQREPRVQALKPPVQRALYFAPASRWLFSQHPEFVQAVWLGLCERSRQQPELAQAGEPCR